MNFRSILLLSSAVLSAHTMVHAEDAEEADSRTIVVTATRLEQDKETVPASISVATMDALRQNGFVTGTDEFRGVPGVFFRRGEGDSDEFPFVSFRGSTGTDGSLSLIDGIPIVGPYEETQLYDLPYDAFERVEILKGPNSALYGRGALYGSTNYITRSARNNVTSFAATAGSDNFYRGELVFGRKLGDNGGALLSGVYEHNGGWRDKDLRKIWNIFGKVETDLGETTRLTAYLTYNDRNTRPTNAIPLGADGRVLDVFGGREGFLGFGDPFNHTRTLFGVVKLEQELSEGLTLTLTGHGRRNKRDTFLNFFDSFALDVDNGIVGFNGFRGRTRQKAYFGEAVLNWQTGSHNIVAGIGGEKSKITGQERWTGENGFTFDCNFTFYSIQIDYRTGQVLNRNNPCFVVDELLSQSRFNNSFWGAFVQDEISLAERFTLTLGARYDSFKRISNFTPIAAITGGGRLTGKADAISPKVSLSYRPEWGQLYASFSRGFNSNFGPTFEWDPFQYARPENKPTTLDSYEVGVKGRALNDTLRFETALFYTRQKNRRISDFNPAAATDPTAPFNLITFGSLLESKGAEVSLDIRPQDGTQIRINYSYIDPEWKDFALGTTDLSGTTPTGVAKNMVYINASQQITPWLTGRAIFEWYDDYKITQSNNFEGGGYELVTLGARIAPEKWQGVTLDLTLLNALDKEYYFFFGGRTFQATHATPGTPRQFRATLKASF